MIALCRAAAPYGGRYVSHIRSEGNRFLESLDELIAFARESGIAAEIYHLKAAGQANWPKLDAAIQKIERARREGLTITADMYTYPAASTGLDAAMPPWVQEGVFLKSSVHPRAYGSFARLLAKYVRDEKAIPLEEAVRRLTLFPAENLKIKERGALRPGWFADIVVFDAAKIQDHATYEKPQQYATGVVHVFVNGVRVLEDGGHTGARPGRFVRGPGWKPTPGSAPRK